MIVHGTHDNIVNPVDANKIREYYEQFHVNPDNVIKINQFHVIFWILSIRIGISPDWNDCT